MAVRTFRDGIIRPGMFGVVLGFATGDDYYDSDLGDLFKLATLSDFSQCPGASGASNEYPVARFVESNNHTLLAMCKPIPYKTIKSKEGKIVGQVKQVGPCSTSCYSKRRKIRY